MAAEIIEFPDRKIVEVQTTADTSHNEGPRRCDLCVHFMAGHLGEYCRAYNEDLMSVFEAEDCEDYTPI